MRRRDVLVFLGAAAWAFSASAQQPGRLRRIGVLMSYAETDPEAQERLAAFRRSLEQAGVVEGRDARIEVRWHAGAPERAKALAKELVDLEPDVIVVNGTPGVVALRQLTGSIPIVFVVVTDPVGAGFVSNLSRPGGNVTGFSTFEPEIGGKWLETLKAIAPHVRRVGILADPSQSGFARLRQAVEAAAPSFGLEAVPADARDGSDIERAVEAFARTPNGGLVVMPNPINSVHRQSIFALAARHRLPAVYPFAFHARDGGLVAYGFDAVDLFRQAGTYVRRILNGEKPGELPVQAPTKFELVVNLKTAKALGLEVPPSLLARADEVIE